MTRSYIKEKGESEPIEIVRYDEENKTIAKRGDLRASCKGIGFNAEELACMRLREIEHNVLNERFKRKHKKEKSMKIIAEILLLLALIVSIIVNYLIIR